MKYKIIEINSLDHSIVVRFFTNKITEADLAIQIEDGTGKVLRARTDVSIALPVPAPRGQDLKRFILRFAPSDWLTTKEAVADPLVDTDLAYLLDQLDVEENSTVETDPNVFSIPVELVQT